MFPPIFDWTLPPPDFRPPSHYLADPDCATLFRIISRKTRLPAWCRGSAGQGGGHYAAGLLDDGVEMGLSLETFRIDLVDVFRAGRSRREPTARRHYLEPADRRSVP